MEADFIVRFLSVHPHCFMLSYLCCMTEEEKYAYAIDLSSFKFKERKKRYVKGNTKHSPPCPNGIYSKSDIINVVL